MSADQKVLFVICQKCGKQIKFLDEEPHLEQPSSRTFTIYDPSFPNWVTCGECGDKSYYEVAHELNATE